MLPSIEELSHELKDSAMDPILFYSILFKITSFSKDVPTSTKSTIKHGILFLRLVYILSTQ